MSDKKVCASCGELNFESVIRCRHCNNPTSTQTKLGQSRGIKILVVLGFVAIIVFTIDRSVTSNAPQATDLGRNGDAIITPSDRAIYVHRLNSELGRKLGDAVRMRGNSNEVIIFEFSGRRTSSKNILSGASHMLRRLGFVKVEIHDDDGEFTYDIESETIKTSGPTNPPPRLRPSEPTIGMSTDELKALCGPLNPLTDDMDTYESRLGFTSIYHYEYSEERAGKHCYGTFTFRDQALESISR